MENEQEDDIITSENNDEAEEGKEEEVEEESTETTEKKEVEKSKESPEAKKARLERQLKKVNRELGIEEKPKSKEEAPKKKGLSDEDLIYIARTDIHDEDLPEVREYAEWKGVSIREAHQKMKPILDTRAEERKTAAATNTRSPRGTSKPDGTKILADAQRGKLPNETDKEGIDALVNAHLASKQPTHSKR